MDKFYKMVSCKNKNSFFVSNYSYKDYIKSKNWLPKINHVSFCRAGYHFTNISGIVQWSGIKSVEIYEIESTDFKYDSYDNKYVSSSIRFTKKIGRINHSDCTYLLLLIIKMIFKSKSIQNELTGLMDDILKYYSMPIKQQNLYCNRMKVLGRINSFDFKNYGDNVLLNRHTGITLKDFINMIREKMRYHLYGNSVDLFDYWINIILCNLIHISESESKKFFGELLLLYMDNNKKRDESMYTEFIESIFKLQKKGEI